MSFANWVLAKSKILPMRLKNDWEFKFEIGWIVRLILQTEMMAEPAKVKKFGCHFHSFLFHYTKASSAIGILKSQLEGSPLRPDDSLIGKGNIRQPDSGYSCLAYC